MKTLLVWPLAARLGVATSWLVDLIQFESGWDPKARNPISGARGLIQFLHSTAKGLGYEDADDLVRRNPTATQQLVDCCYRFIRCGCIFVINE